MRNIPEIKFNNRRVEHINGFELKVLEEFISNLKKPTDHDPFQAHRLSFNIILIITDGMVRHSVDFETHDLQEGDVMVISKGQIHAFDVHSRYKGYMMLFTEEFMQKYIASSTIAQINHLYNYFLGQKKINNPDHNQTLIRSLKKELQRNSSTLPNVIGALLSIYLLKMNDENDRSSNFIVNKYLDCFNHFKLLVEKNFSKSRDAKTYAAEMSVSYKFLNQVCKEIVKTTAKAFIDSYVILEAKRILVTTSLSVKETAYALGFDEPTNFLKYFKKHTSCTPAGFRKL
ncbi:AraC family transcriptional regulator [Saccharicrinis sp. 156]|uniref:AraC family transcriptional regulator n=1 Tax=Saccharicrinis sp. 156 TaxID=3417574 RepID=UPI003D34DB8A